MRPTKLLALAAILGAPALASAQGPTGTLYLTAGDNFTNWRVQGLTATPFAQANNLGNQGEYAIAVSGDVRTLANGNDANPAQLGSQYTLGGVYTGTSYPYPSTFARFYDGTTDGTNNYSVDYFGGGVYQMDRNWGGAQLLFNSGLSNPLGITYDNVSNSLWIADFTSTAPGVFTTLNQYSMAGGLLNSYLLTESFVAALAMDYSDGTLWFTSNGSATLYQYTTSGTALGHESYNELSGQNVLGGEFNLAAVPEPSTYALMATGLAFLAAAARRRRAAA